MTTRRMLDLLILASLALWGVALFSAFFLKQFLAIVPLSLGYAFVEAGVPLLRRWWGAAVDPSTPERHRYCMLLYVQALTAADPWVAGAVLLYAILLHAIVGRARWIAHALGIVALATTTALVEPPGLAAWAPAPTLLGLAVWLRSLRRASANPSSNAADHGDRG